MKYSQLVSPNKSLLVKIGDSGVNVTYDVGALSNDKLFNDDIMADQNKFTVKLLLSTLKSWDLEDDAGNIYPISEEVLPTLNIGFLNIIAEAIIKDGTLLSKK